MKLLARSVIAIAVALVGLRAAEPDPATQGFDAAMIPSTQYAHADIFFRTPSGFPPALALTREIAPGQRLDLLVLASGYAVNKDSEAHVTYELVIHRPDGKELRLPDRVTIAENTRIEPRHLIFPTGITRFATESGNPSGDYRFEITALDHVSGQTAMKSIVVRVSDSAESLPLPDDTDMSRFLMDYYQRPRPRLALAALSAFSRSPYAPRKADTQGTLIGFYDQVLNDNPWLLSQFTQRLSTTKDDSERRIVALVLAHTKREDSNFGEDLPRTARTALTNARKESPPSRSLEPTQGAQLDLEWGAFLASGRFAPIANLVAVVQNYLPYRGKLEDYKKLPVKPPTPPPEVLKDILLNTALWSLGSNAHQHKLVRYYLIGIEKASETPPAVKDLLREALAWQPKDAPDFPREVRGCDAPSRSLSGAVKPAPAKAVSRPPHSISIRNPPATFASFADLA